MLFKDTLNTKADEIRNYIAVNSSISFASIRPYIESAEAKYIKPILGNDQYTELAAYYDDPSTWPDPPDAESAKSENLAQLLKLVQKSLINLAFMEGFSVLSINIGDSGAYRKESENQKSLYQYQEENLKDTFRSEGFNGLDIILEYLETNIADFPVFKDSDTYTVFQSKFVHTTSDFEAIYNISNSRLVFLHMQKYIDQVNDFSLLPVIGRNFFDELLAASISGAISDKQQIVINFIKKIQVFMSVARGMASLGVNITYNGAYFLSHDTNSSNFKKKDPLSAEWLHKDMRNNEQLGSGYIDYMKDYLHSNITDFPTYAAFNAYNEGEPVSHRDNTDKKTFWT